jgi:hypothetical protein
LLSADILALRLHNNVLSADQHDAAQRHLVERSDSLADHSVGIMADLAIWQM